MSVILSGEAVSRRFGGLKAVDEVDFHLEEGEILGLIGPNGAGKTTLFSVIAGSIPPSGGRIALDGETITGEVAHRVVHRGVCRTHQVVRPFAKLTVIENVMVGALYRGPAERVRSMGAAREIASDFVRFVGLQDRAHNFPGELTLSGRKRLEVARALATRPRVLLLDEVVAGLNPTETQKMVDLIASIREAGTSIIMIEHVMQAVMGLSDRVIVLDYGRKIAEGTAQQVVDDPKVIEAYLGSESGAALPPASRGVDGASDARD